MIRRCREGEENQALRDAVDRLHDDIVQAHEDLDLPARNKVDVGFAEAFHEAGLEHIQALDALRDYLEEPDESHLERAQERLDEARNSLGRLDSLMDQVRQVLSRPREFGAG